jgi:peptidoglycan/LPS O-acetylase OafA/YrhL
MWFFSVIIQFYILYPIIKKIYDFFDKKKKIGLLLSICLFIQTVWLVMVIIYQETLIRRLFLDLLFYFVLGMFASRNFEALKKCYKQLPTLILIPSSAILTAVGSLFLIIGLKTGTDFQSIQNIFWCGVRCLEPFLFIFAILLYFKISDALINRKNVVSFFISSTGRLSFGIYLIHMIFNSLVANALVSRGILYDNWIFYPIVYFSSVVLSYLSTYLISYLPFSKYIIGVATSKKTG